MKKKLTILFTLALAFILSISFAQTKQTYTINGTTYYYEETYKTTGKPKVERSYSAKHEFLKSLGYDKVPEGYQVDHIIPLSQGGLDDPSNMQLLTIEQHKIKTANERSLNSTNSTYNSFDIYSTPTYDFNSGKTIYTGSKGGQYYINSNGNKTYIKKK